VTNGKQPTSIAVLPNPVKGNIAHLQFNNFKENSYAVELSNATGQKLFSSVLKIAAGNSVQEFQLPPALKSGLYYLIVLDKQKNTFATLIKQ
jgi:hypothetical protein